VCVRVSSSSENNKLGVYNDIYKYLYRPNPRVLARALYRYIVTVCACMCMLGGVYVCMCVRCVLVEVESRVGEIYDVVFMAIEQMDSGFMCTSSTLGSRRE